jgi:hypothetical protein
VIALLESLDGPRWVFFLTAGTVAGLALDSLASVLRWPDAVTNHLWLVPFIAFLLLFLLRDRDSALAAFAALVVVRIGTYLRINRRYPVKSRGE